MDGRPWWWVTVLAVTSLACDPGPLSIGCESDDDCPPDDVCVANVCSFQAPEGEGEGEGEDETEGGPLRAVALAPQTVDEDVPLVVQLSVTGGDGGSIMWRSSAPTVAGASVSLDGDMLTWRGPADVGDVTDSLLVTPSQGGTDGEATTVTITVIARNDPPTLTLSSTVVLGLEDTPGEVAGFAIAGPGPDVGDAVTLTVSFDDDVSELFDALPSVTDQGTLVWMGARDRFTGPLAGRVIATDTAGAQTEAFFTLELAGQNDPPSCVPHDVTINEDDAVDADDAIIVADLITAGPFEDGGVSFEVEVLEGAELAASAPIVGDDGSLRLVTTANESGTIRLRLTPIETIDAAEVEGAPHEVVITVAPVNDPPSFRAMPLAAIEDVHLVGVSVAADVSAGPRELEEVTIELELPAAQDLIARVTPRGAVNFDLELVPDANGVLTFDIVARDAAGLVTRLPSTLTVAPVNDPPRFVAHDVAVLEDGSVSGERVATGVVPGPTNESGTVTLTVAVVGGDAVFVATQPPAISSDGRLSGGVLVPDRNGTAQLQVRASDPEGAITVETIDVVVAPVNDPPVLLGPRVMATPHNTTNAFELILTDVDSDEPVVASSSQPAFATVAVIEGTRLTITPNNATATGRADVELRLIDEQGGDAIETVSIAVLGRQPSCFHYRAQNASVGDGVYSLLQPQDTSRGCFAVDGCPYSAFCDMEDGDAGDDGGGWTLVMKIDGDDDGFDFTDARWEDFIVGAPQSGDSDHLARAATADLIVDNDIKLRSFLAVKVEELRVGFAPRTADSRSFVFVSPHMVLGESPVDSARVLFAGSERVILRPDRSDWLAVDDRFRLQRNCNRAGVNLGKGRNAAGSVNFLRLGVLGNDQGDCFSPDSFVGIGSSVSNTAGNLALFNGLGTTDQRRFGALLVRSTDLTDVGSFDSCNDVAAAGFVDDEAVFLVNGQPTVCAP